MRKLLFGLIATVFISITSFGQSSEKAAGCSADCFFNDCMVRCPSGSIPKCKCIVGSFSSCSCAEAVGRSVIKNENSIDKILQFLDTNNLDNFKTLFSNLFDALKRGDENAFSINFDRLELLTLEEVDNAKRVEEFVDTLRIK